MKNWPYILIIILLIVIIALEDRNHKLEREKLLSKEYDLQQQLEQTTRELGRSNERRDSLLAINNSLNSHLGILHTSLKAKDRELASIKGRYKNIPVDSLANLMEQRAWKRER